MSIHQKIRDARKALGLTEQQFADAVNVTRAAVQQWEKEGGTAPTRKNQPKVANFLGISVAELVGGSPTEAQTVASLGLTLEALSGHLVKINPEAREMTAGLLSELAFKPERHAWIAAMLLALPGDGERQPVESPPKSRLSAYIERTRRAPIPKLAIKKRRA